MVRLRLCRAGKRNAAYWRIGAFYKKDRRDGEPSEYLGSYNPHAEGEEKYHLKEDRIRYWLSVGAQPSDTVASILRKAGVRKPSEGEPVEVAEAAEAEETEEAEEPEGDEE
jgi:small subunit ribosomal protein S16